MKIESFIPGRVRLRSPLFKDELCAHTIANALVSVRGVARADVNRLTGGMLLEYDSSEITINRIMSAAPLIERISAAESAEPADRLAMISSMLNDIKEMIEREPEGQSV